MNAPAVVPGTQRGRSASRGLQRVGRKPVLITGYLTYILIAVPVVGLVHLVHMVLNGVARCRHSRCSSPRLERRPCRHDPHSG
jgi:hypothetical protein